MLSLSNVLLYSNSCDVLRPYRCKTGENAITINNDLPKLRTLRLTIVICRGKWRGCQGSCRSCPGRIFRVRRQNKPMDFDLNFNGRKKRSNNFMYIFSPHFSETKNGIFEVFSKSFHWIFEKLYQTKDIQKWTFFQNQPFFFYFFLNQLNRFSQITDHRH